MSYMLYLMKNYQMNCSKKKLTSDAIEIIKDQLMLWKLGEQTGIYI